MRGKVVEKWLDFKVWVYWQQQFFWRGVHRTARDVAKYAQKHVTDPILSQNLQEEPPHNYGRGKWYSR